MTTKVFMQGMRRSGTTIAFDCFLEDKRINCQYEPLRENRTTPGGGSGAHTIDFMDEITKDRVKFNAISSLNLDMDEFNYGAPRDGRLEYSQEFSEPIASYLRFILDKSDNTLIKCTRFMEKAASLKKIAPEASFIHVVRNPMLVANSFLFGKGRKNEHKFEDHNIYFERRSTKTAWSSYLLSNIILEKPEYRNLANNISDLERVLLLWAYNFKVTHEQGQKVFGNKYLLVRHEDLLFKQKETLEKMYTHIQLSPCSEVLKWANNNIRANKLKYFHPEDERWSKSFKRLDMEKQLIEAGYTPNNLTKQYV